MAFYPDPVNADEVRREIAHARSRLMRAARDVRHEVAWRSSLTEWVRRRPAALLLGAFAVGWLLARRRR